MQMRNVDRIEPAPAAGPGRSGERKARARKRPKGAPTHVRSWPLRPNPMQCRDIRNAVFHGHPCIQRGVGGVHRAWPGGEIRSSMGDRPPCRKPVCAGPQEKADVPTGSPCGCGIKEHRDLISAYLGLHVRTGADGSDRLDLQAARQGWLHRQDVYGRRGLAVAALSNRRGRRHPPTRRSVARINARRAAKRQSRSARTSTTN
jgi:hypothetical protein